MKTLSFIFTLIFLSSSSFLFSQNKNSSKPKIAYWSIGYHFSLVMDKNHSQKFPILQGLRGSLYLDNNFLISGSFKSSRTFSSDNFPNNYKNGTQLFDFGFDDGISENKINVLTLGFGKILNPRIQIFRFTFESGVSLIQYSPAKYVTQPAPTSFALISPSTHHVEYPQKEIGIGLNLRTSIEINWLRFYGWALAIEGNINSKQSYFSIGGLFHFGKIRKRNKFFTK